MGVVVAEEEKEEGAVEKVVEEEATAIPAKLGEEASLSDREVLEQLQDPTSTQVGEECRGMEEPLLHRRPFQPCLGPSANLMMLSCSKALISFFTSLKPRMDFFPT